MRLSDRETLRTWWTGLVERCGDRCFLRFQACDASTRSFTYAEFYAYVRRMANFLIEDGVRPGENIAVQLYNSPESIAALFAITEAGAVSVPLNIQHKLDECVHVIERCNIGRIIMDPDFQEYYDGREGSYAIPRLYVSHASDGTLSPGSIDFDAAVARQSDVLSEVRPQTSGDVVEIMFTSGTTSAPKGVEVTHANFVLSGQYGCWQHAMRPDDVFLTTMPAFHSNFQLAALTPVLAAGATLVFVAKYSARRFWSQVVSHGATLTQMVSMMVKTTLMQPVDAHERDHRLRSVQYYLPLGEEEKDRFENRFRARLQNCYGLTESICWAATEPSFERGPWPSVGRVGIGYAVEVRRADGSCASSGEEGEICIQGVPGTTLMKGYYQDAAATAQALDGDGWLHTGDVGVFDERGWLFFVDRDSNMIKRAGENISAAEVEHAIMEMPQVKEAAVIGVADSVRDEAVKAFVALEAGAHVSADEIRSFCAQRLADYKVPGFVAFVDALPKTSVGKVAKKLLREE